ncbi:mechanosensitive ion channel protein 10-like [Corylus avellana]|uniref:mechanosensitive ion channel protein 10-like n=1 Tax=Corylus avellana TaxID=13451 RepID=UPI00286BCE3C|nr:mechanosensitive ion channel protein 10-like [Corylus avellana]XP_059453228.1 mechanosensitive ion channel protein 10-like [Corylus avellana]
MDAKQTALRGGEVSMVENKAPNDGQVVLEIPEIKDAKGSSPKASESWKQSRVESPLKPSTESTTDFSKSVPVSCPSPEISRFSPSPNKPPKVPTTNENLTRRRSLARSVYSKPKSRFGEQPYATYGNMFDENGSALQEQTGAGSPYRNSFNVASPNNKMSRSTTRTASITPKTPLMASPGHDEDEEIYKKVKLNKEKHRKVKTKALVELIAFVCILGCLVASLTAERLKTVAVWSLEFWKWWVLVMVIFSGMLVTNWFMHVIVFLIERNFLLRKKVLYFVHGLKKSVQVFIWLSLVLLTWELLFNRGIKRSKTATKVLSYITWTLVSLLVGAFLWLLKTLLLKILASNFHVNTFFDRIQESIFHQYVLQTLSGPPLIEEAERVGRTASTGQLSFRNTKKSKGKKEKEVIDMGKLHKMKQEKVSAWTMKMLVDAVMSSGLSTISNALDESVDDEGGEQTDKEITNEMEATAAAYHIFRNVAQPGCKYIDEDDLMRFMIKEEVDLVFPLLEGGETGRIDRKDLTDWVVKVYKGRKALAHALNDTKTAVKQLNKLVTVILIVVTILVWLLLMEIATTKVLVFLSSQLVVAAFMFGNTCKTIFEAIIFVFVMHPFDVGDRCVIDGVTMMVEEMNILTTVFLKLDFEKVYYPNSVLATKPISNYYRSPNMGDSVEFSIDFMTPAERIGMLKDKIKKFLEKNPQHWHANHNLAVKEIENVNKIKMGLFVFHTINFQDVGEKTRRRTELVMEIKRIFEELNIKYNLLPQAVHLANPGSETTNATNR